MILENHRTMQAPGQGIVRVNGPTTQHSEFPKHMVHPGFRPGVADKEVKVPDPVTGKPWRVAYVGGEPIRFPPVLVMDENQEAYHESQGYVSIGKSDPAAFARAVAAATAAGPEHVPDQYPKWVAALGRAVDSAEEEAEALGAPASSEETRAIPAESAEVNTLTVPPPSDTDARIAALEGKVGDIMEGFGRVEALLARLSGAHPEPSRAPSPERQARPAQPRHRLPPPGGAVPRSAASIARGEAIRAGHARRKEALAAAAAKAPDPVVAAPEAAVE